MRKKLILAAVYLIVVTACGKHPINGKLDGRWQLMVIDYHHPDSVSRNPEFTYFDFQLKLMQLARTGGDEYKTRSIWTRFHHAEDSLHIQAISNNGKKIQLKEMLPFGMNDTIQHFKVEELTRKRMILNSTYTRLELRKF